MKAFSHVLADMKKKSGYEPYGEQGGRLCKLHPGGPKYLPIEQFVQVHSKDRTPTYRDRCSACHNEWLRQYHQNRKNKAIFEKNTAINKLWKPTNVD